MKNDAFASYKTPKKVTLYMREDMEERRKKKHARRLRNENLAKAETKKVFSRLERLPPFQLSSSRPELDGRKTVGKREVEVL